MPFPESTFARSGRFSEIYPVGGGAVGRVYSAVDNLGRRVAVKEALPAAEGFASFRAKFEKEARLQAALDHPNIVRVHHLEEDPQSGELYLICEYADAGSLADLIERAGPLPPARAIAVARDICAALEETAARRIVHRDVKPSNILLFTTPAGLTAKLGDFGIAQDARQRKTTMLPGASHPGTPLYMAPEQADVTAVLDTRADLFALGLTLWEMLTGEDYKALLRGGAGPTLQAYRPDASPALGQVIARAVRPDREERYQTPRELADDLGRLLGSQAPAPQTVRIARAARQTSAARHASPAAPLGFAPVALTLTLLSAAVAFAFVITGVFGLLMGGEAYTMPTSVPPALFEGGTALPTVPPPTATPASLGRPAAAPHPPAPTVPPFNPAGEPTSTPVPYVPAPPTSPPPDGLPLAPTNTPADLIPLPTDTPADAGGP